jgi:hypothetical protein
MVKWLLQITSLSFGNCHHFPVVWSKMKFSYIDPNCYILLHDMPMLLESQNLATNWSSVGLKASRKR